MEIDQMQKTKIKYCRDFCTKHHISCINTHATLKGLLKNLAIVKT